MESLDLDVSETPSTDLKQLLSSPGVQVSVAVLVWDRGAADGQSQRVHERFVEVESANDLRKLASAIDAATEKHWAALATA